MTNLIEALQDKLSRMQAELVRIQAEQESLRYLLERLGTIESLRLRSGSELSPGDSRRQ